MIGMQAKEVLLDLLSDNSNRVHQLLDEISDDCLHWQPHPDTNSIAITLWHVSRAFDVFLTQHILARPNTEENWVKSNWKQKTGYDPRGLGTNGWGMLTGYNREEVGAIPQFSKEILRGYYDEMDSTIRSFVEGTGEEMLAQAAPGVEGRRTNFYWIRHPLFDLTRHVGEMLALRTIWDLQMKKEGPD